MGSVSYTHLDVYKRQVLSIAAHLSLFCHLKQFLEEIIIQKLYFYIVISKYNF